MVDMNSFKHRASLSRLTRRSCFLTNKKSLKLDRVPSKRSRTISFGFTPLCIKSSIRSKVSAPVLPSKPYQTVSARSPIPHKVRYKIFAAFEICDTCLDTWYLLWHIAAHCPDHLNAQQLFSLKVNCTMYIR